MKIEKILIETFLKRTDQKSEHLSSLPTQPKIDSAD